MWWIAPLAGAAMGAYLGKQQQKAQEDARKDQALINMYAPLFGQAPRTVGAREDKVTPAVMQGAMSGYQMASQAQTNDRLANLYARDTANPTSTAQTPIVDFASNRARGGAYIAPEPVYMPYAQNQSMAAARPYAYGTNPLSFLGG